MEQTRYRIGYSECGGIYIGKNIQSDFHKNHLLTLVLSLSEPFEIITKMNQSYSYEAAFIPKDTLYKLSTSQNDWTVFIHIDPYSEIGMKLNPKDSRIQRFNRCLTYRRIFRSTTFYKSVQEIFWNKTVFKQTLAD